MVVGAKCANAVLDSPDMIFVILALSSTPLFCSVARFISDSCNISAGAGDCSGFLLPVCAFVVATAVGVAAAVGVDAAVGAVDAAAGSFGLHILTTLGQASLL